jgi:hypothetical protein
LLVLVQGEIPVLGFLLYKGIAGFCIIGIDKFLGRECSTALLALVAVSLGSMATGTFTLDVTVGKEAASSLVKELLADLLHKLAFLVEFLEEVACKLVMNGTAGARVYIEGDAKLFERVLDDAMIAVNNLLHADTLLASTNGNGYTMLVATTNEEYIALLQAQISHVDIGRHIYTSQMTDVYRAVGIGKSRCNGGSFEILFHI